MVTPWPQILLGCLILGFAVGVVFRPFTWLRRRAGRSRW